FTQALPKRGHAIGIGLSRTGTEETYHRHSRLLCACCERPRHGHAAERDYELSSSDVNCHVTLPKGSCSCNSGHDITLLFRGAPSMTARGQQRRLAARSHEVCFTPMSSHHAISL